MDLAADGIQSLQMFKQSAANHYDLVLMDIQMSNLNGYQAAREIRDLDWQDGKTISIAAMTANTFREDAERVLAAGSDGHLIKPIDII